MDLNRPHDSHIYSRLGKPPTVRKIRSLFFVFLFVCATGPVRGGFEDLPVGGRMIGMGSAYVAVAQGPESVFSNPAGLSQAPGPAFTLFVARPFGIRELTHETVSGVFPTHYGGLGLTLQTFGHSLYRENTLAVGWASRYRSKLHVGILLRIVHLQIQKYGSATGLVVDVGGLVRLTENLIWGVALTNLNRGRMGDRRTLPQISRMGLSCTPLPELLLSVEIDKDTPYPVELRGGCEIRPTSALALRCGFGRDPNFISAGIGLTWGIFCSDYGFTHHPVLGVTHQGSLSFNLNRQSPASSTP